uniref:Uncharacterized protein n=1 Tax=Arundo donax TaxID=35708 RepID=A0A0A8Y6K1_ARUDO
MATEQMGEIAHKALKTNCFRAGTINFFPVLKLPLDFVVASLRLPLRPSSV